MSTTRFVLIGSGLAGGLLAAYLGRRGYDVDLYERRADPREGNIVGGRSINLALSTRGIHALERVGIADEVLRHAIPMRGRMIHDKSGGLHFAPYDVDPNKYINSIGRASLNTVVIEAAQRYPNVQVHFNRFKEAIQSGQLILAGRTQEPGNRTFGIAIFVAADEAAARKFMEDDPAVVAGLMIAELHPFAVALQRKNP